MRNTVSLSNKAAITLDQLSPEDQERIDRIIQSLKEFPDQKPIPLVRKLKSLEDHYIVRASNYYKIVFTIQEHHITIIDIINYSRLKSLFSSAEGNN